MNSPACWPTATQELLLLASFAAEDRAQSALDECLPQLKLDSLDVTSDRLLPLLFHRWGDRLPDRALYQRAYLSYTNIWRSNQRRFLMALAISRDLLQAGVPCLFLKGLALTVCHYRDPALRAMEDVDLMVRPKDVAAAADALQRAGWRPEENAETSGILRQTRVRHAWQFHRGPDESCDLHWHPVLRCYSPDVAELFWQGARDAEIHQRPLRIPCATDLLFHVCAHGLQWSWTPQIRWIPDALTILQSPSEIDWERLLHLAALAEMNVRLHQALQYLQERFAAPVPAAVLARLQATGGPWEQREYHLLQKECPLGFVDRARWHTTNFHRLRPFDSDWSAALWPAAFAGYVSVFLNRSGIRETARALIAQSEEAPRSG